MKMKFHCTLGLGSIMLLVAFCNTPTSPPRELTTQEHALVASSNQFGFKLLNEVVKQSDGSNVFVSPLSISMALGMTLNGAEGETLEGMKSALEHNGLRLEEINEGYRGLLDVLPKLDASVAMEIANSIWYRNDFEVLESFIDINQTYFDAVVEALDFSSPKAAPTINNWVKDKTHEKIEKIVDDPIDPLTVMFLINAVYFKADWTKKFDPKNTQDADFTTGEGKVRSVKMMNLEDELEVLEGDGFKAVRLSYGDHQFSMSLFLPNPDGNIDQLVASLDENWETWQAGFSLQEAMLFLPRFELEYEQSLNEVLKALGMELAFSASADFSKMRASGGLFISEVKHKTYVNVDEKGTEAAAVTSVEMRETSIPPEKFMMRIDRPFVMVIHDLHANALLFMGKITDLPSE